MHISFECIYLSIYLSLYLSVGLSTCLFSNNFNRSTGTHSKQDTCHESLYTALGNNVTKKQFKQLQSMDVDTPNRIRAMSVPAPPLSCLALATTCFRAET